MFPHKWGGADYLTWSDVRELHAEGVQSGSHTVIHPDLRSLDPEQIEYELGCLKVTIEQRLGCAVESFAYPFGLPEEDKRFTRFLEDVLEDQGFANGVSTIIGRPDANTTNSSFRACLSMTGMMPRCSVRNSRVAKTGCTGRRD